MNDSELDLTCKKNLDKNYYFFAEKSSCKDDNTHPKKFHFFGEKIPLLGEHVRSDNDIHGICKKAIFFSNTTPVTVRTSNSCGDPTDRKIRERKSLSDGFSLISCSPEYAEVGPLMSL